MKEKLVYQSDKGIGLQDIYLLKSAALGADARYEASAVSRKLANCPREQEFLERAFIILAEREISPGKLNRAYLRIWKIIKAVQLSLDEERIAEEEQIPF
jgi:hypothetical protein